MLKKVLYTVIILALIGAGTAVYLWNKPHKKVENAEGIKISAVDLFKAYSADENKANALYLNKAIEVSGEISEIDKNQDGGSMFILATGDAMMNVQCTMREKTVSASKGQKVSIKGFCSGSSITGISLTDCVMN
jgi:hypothetical protein